MPVEQSVSQNHGLLFSPRSSYSVERKPRGGVIVFSECVPPEIITDVVTNDLAAQVIDPRFHFICTKDYLVANTRMTTPVNGEGDPILTSKIWGRSIPVGYGFIPYLFFCGGLVMAKGCSTSGYKYNSYDPGSTHDPWGFFGYRDAKREILIGNALLAEGFRAALPLGLVVLDFEKLAQWLGQKWADTSLIKKSVLHNLDMVRQNGDNPVVYFRLSGTSERLDSLIPRDYRRVQAEIARAARLLRREAELFPAHFQTYLNGSVSTDAALAVLEKISRREFGNLQLPDNFEIYCKIIAGIFAQNARALLKVFSRSQSITYGGMNTFLADGKDIDTAFFSQDYEQIGHFYDDSSPKQKVRDYISVAFSDIGINAFIEKYVCPSYKGKMRDIKRGLTIPYI